MQQLKQQSASAMPDAGAVAVAVPLATVTRSILASEAVPVGATADAVVGTALPAAGCAIEPASQPQAAGAAAEALAPPAVAAVAAVEAEAEVATPAELPAAVAAEAEVANPAESPAQAQPAAGGPAAVELQELTGAGRV